MSQKLKSITIDGQKLEIAGEQPKFETYEFLVTNDNPRVSIYSSGSYKQIQLDVTGLDKKSVCLFFPNPFANLASKNKTLDLTSATTVNFYFFTTDYQTERPIFFIDQFIYDTGTQIREGITYGGELIFLSNQNEVIVGFANDGIINSSNNGVERLLDLSFNQTIFTQDGATVFTYPYFFRQGIFINGFITATMLEF